MSVTISDVEVPATSPDDPTVFVIVQGGWGGGGDLAGLLMHADGEVAWSHISSSEGWLRRDLTTGFPDRRDALESRYGETVNLATIRGWSHAPGWLREAHEHWSASQDTEATS